MPKTTARLALAGFVVLFGLSQLNCQSITSPRGMATTEGSTSFPGWGNQMRMMQIDNSHVGSSFTIRSLAWRREGSRAQTVGPQIVRLNIDLGLANFANLSNLFDANYLPGSKVRVFSGTVNFPGWTTSIPGPAPFDFVVQLQTPFVYSGSAALVIDVDTVSGFTSRPAMDFDGSVLFPSSAGTLGTGCVATGRTRPFTLGVEPRNMGAAANLTRPLRLSYRTSDNPPSMTAAVALVDGTDRDLSTVLCTKLHADPAVSFPLSVYQGGIEQDYGFPFQSALIGATLVTQVVAPDAGQTIPIALTNGVSFRFSTRPTPSSHDAAFMWSFHPGTRGMLDFGRASVIELGL